MSEHDLHARAAQSTDVLKDYQLSPIAFRPMQNCDILNNAQLCAAHYYIGLALLTKGDLPAARASFQYCLASNRLNDPCYLLARAELARMDKKS